MGKKMREARNFRIKIWKLLPLDKPEPQIIVADKFLNVIPRDVFHRLKRILNFRWR